MDKDFGNTESCSLRRKAARFVTPTAGVGAGGVGYWTCQVPVAVLKARVRVQTAPPWPSFTHWAQDSPQPPLVAPPQFRPSGAASSQVPVAGLSSCCMRGAGVVPDTEPLDELDSPK